MSTFNKTLFDTTLQNGMKSFKMISNDKKLNDIIYKINKECIQRLDNGINEGNQNGFIISVESPKCCLDYAEFNIDRRVPLRQHFGKTINENKKYATRWTYGVGSGNQTVGGDTKITKNRPFTNTMKTMCNMLNKMEILKCNGDYCIKPKEKLDFNSVTVLYYLMDSRGTNVINLKPHCDLEVNARNIVNKNNSQKPGTPTVVLSLQSDKKLDFYKRYSNGTSFVNDNNGGGKHKVDSMILNHGELFILHPDDERVFARKIRSKENVNKSKREEMKSQFQHGVTCSISKNKDAGSGEGYKISISVCFRQTVVNEKYCRQYNIMIDKDLMWADNDSKTMAMTNRNNNIINKRKELMDGNNVKRIENYLKMFWKYAIVKK